nr:hypothetical protein [Burkholderia paludis]
MRQLWPGPENIRRRRVCAPAALSVARQRAGTAQRDRRLAAAVGRPRDQGRQAACGDRGGGVGRCVRGAGRGRARAGRRRFVEEGRGGIDPPRARASCRQPHEDGGPARHREEHALRKDPQVSSARCGERRPPESRAVSRGGCRRATGAAARGVVASFRPRLSAFCKE